MKEELKKQGNYLYKIESIEKFNDFPKLKKNPFVQQAISAFEMKGKIKGAVNGITSMELIDKDSGEIISGIKENRVFVKQEYVDNSKFLKVYINRFRESFDLSVSAQKIFMFFLLEMQKPENRDRDKIYLNKEECLEYCNYTSHRMYYIGLTELMQHGFIAKCENPPGHYWIDINTAFNGNRIVIMEEYIRGEMDEEKDTKAIEDGRNDFDD